jgi:hypothetical protein
MKAKRRGADLSCFSSFSTRIDYVEINQIVGGKVASNCHRLFSLWCLAMTGTVAGQANSRDSLLVQSIGANFRPFEATIVDRLGQFPTADIPLALPRESHCL